MGGKYCSNACQYIGQIRGNFIPCCICSKEIWKTPAQIKHSQSKKFFCSKSCQTLWRNQLYIGERHSNWVNDMHAYQSIIRRSGILERCNHCRLTDKRVLIVHHIDRNRTNNNVNNLMWLCRNCHYLIHEGKTF
jgi:hypothetical protein